MIDYRLLRVTPARDEDREFSYQVKKAAEGEYIRQAFGWDERRQREFHAREWEERRPDIIEYDGYPIGTVWVGLEEGAVRIGQFFILPDHQRKGIGSHVLHQVLKKADEAGQAVRLAFLKDNPVASLYRRYGFELIQEDERFCSMERSPQADT